MSETIKPSMTPYTELTSGERLDIALESGTWNAGLEEYLKFGQLKPEDLKGKVLDLGSGEIDRFAREATAKGIDVVSIDPFLVTQKRRERVQSGYAPLNPSAHSDLSWSEKGVAGLAQELPFKDGSFDTIVSAAAIPGYLHQADYLVALREVDRVLKPGGKVYLFPLVELPGNNRDDRYSEKVFFEALEASGLNYKTKLVEVPNRLKAYKVVTIEKLA